MEGGTGWSRQAGGAAPSIFSSFGLEKKKEGLPYVEGKGGHNVGLGGSCQNGKGGRSMCNQGVGLFFCFAPQNFLHSSASKFFSSLPVSKFFLSVNKFFSPPHFFSQYSFF